MGQEDRVWLTTGQAARLCSVTPGTVLNWIRKGRLEGFRTAGGHYRIRRDELRTVLARGEAPGSAPAPGGPELDALRCWEYLGDGLSPSEGCQECVVYRLRAARCFRMAALGPEIGHAREFCPTSCERCPYFQRVAGLPTRVLVVTADPMIPEEFASRDDEALVLRFARNAYEASALVEEFLPAFAIVDQDTHPALGGLLESLARDRRLPGLKIVVARSRHVPPRPLGEAERFVDRRITKPFGPRQIADVIESFPVEKLEPGEAGKLSRQSRGRHTMNQAQDAPLAANRDADGFLEQLSSWNRAEAAALADEHEIGELTEEHWRVIEFVQWYYSRFGTGPPVVRVHKETGMSSGDICRLFPCGMVKGAYRLAGLPRPPGCS